MLGVRSQPLGRRNSALDRDTRTAPARQDEFEIIQRLSMLRHQLNEHRLACEALEAAINCETDLDEMEALHAQLRSEEDAFNATLAEMYRWKEVVENQRGSASASTAAAAESHGARHSVVSIAVTEQADVVHDWTSMAPQIQFPDPFPMSPAQTSSQSLPRPSTPVSLVGQGTLTPEDIKGVLMNRHHRSNGNVTPASDRAVAPEQPIVSSFASQLPTSMQPHGATLPDYYVLLADDLDLELENYITARNNMDTQSLDDNVLERTVTRRSDNASEYGAPLEAGMSAWLRTTEQFGSSVEIVATMGDVEAGGREVQPTMSTSVTPAIACVSPVIRLNAQEDSFSSIENGLPQDIESASLPLLFQAEGKNTPVDSTRPDDGGPTELSIQPALTSKAPLPSGWIEVETTHTPSPTMNCPATIMPGLQGSELQFIPEGDLQMFEHIFKVNAGKSQMISAQASRNVFLLSGLPTDLLARIWDLASVRQDASLTFPEFALASFLIKQCVNTRDPVIPVLPTNVHDAVLRAATVAAASGDVSDGQVLKDIGVVEESDSVAGVSTNPAAVGASIEETENSQVAVTTKLEITSHTIIFTSPPTSSQDITVPISEDERQISIASSSIQSLSFKKDSFDVVTATVKTPEPLPDPVEPFVECSSCFSELKKSECVRCPDDHYFCIESCFETLIEAQLPSLKYQNGQLLCPMDNKTAFRVGEVASKVSDVLFAKLNTAIFDSIVAKKVDTIQQEYEARLENALRETEELKARENRETVVKSRAARAANDVREKVLNLQCPKPDCGRVYSEFDGCMSLQCSSCQTRFCAYCHTTRPSYDSIHEHVRECSMSLSQPSYFATDAQKMTAQKNLRVKLLREFLIASTLEVDVKQVMVLELARDLTDLGFLESDIATIFDSCSSRTGPIGPREPVAPTRLQSAEVRARNPTPRVPPVRARGLFGLFRG